MRRLGSTKWLEALERAYEAHKDRLFTIATALVRDRNLAEDVVHDVFARLASEPQRLASSSNLAGYLAVCARYRAISLLRTRARRASLARESAERAAGGVSDDPGELAARAEDNGNLLALVSELPENLREVLALRIWGRLGFREIARSQGVTKSTVHARYRQALEKLRLALSKGLSHD